MTFQKTLSLMLVAAAAAALPLSACAQAYLGAGLGTTDAKKFCGTTTDCDKTGSAWRLYGGYRVGRFVALELAYHDMGRFSSNSGTAVRRVDAGVGEATGLLIYQVSRFSIYGRLGAYYAQSKQEVETAGMTTSTTESNGGVTYGAGAQYDFGQSWGTRLEWQHYAKVGDTATGGTMDVNAFTLSVLYRFR